MAQRQGYAPVIQPQQGFPQQQQQAAARHPYNNNNGETDWVTGPVAMCVAGTLLAAAVVLSIIALVVALGAGGGSSGTGGGTFGEMSIDVNSTGPMLFDFANDTTCIPVNGYQKHHERRVLVNASEGYILVQHGGTYWYEMHLSLTFDEHWLPWTPWKLYVGIDGKKALREGSSQDVLWWADNSTFWSILPVIPFAPADLTLSGIVTLSAGQKLSAFIGIPEFCFNCPLSEAAIHGPAELTVTHGTVSMHMISSSSPAGFLQASMLLLILLVAALSF